MTTRLPTSNTPSHTDAAPRTKVLGHGELVAARALARAAGRKVVQCHGCFDIVHPGHIRHLRQAKSLGDILLVTITGDSEIRKGTGRPLIPEELRAENLAALDFVDWVYIEHRPTAAELLADVAPDVYVKGREYEFNDDPRFKAERDAVESRGGRVIFSSGDVVFSSTALIAAMEHSIDPFHKQLSQLLETSELDGASLYSLVAAFRGKRVVVLGDSILDTYVLCDRPEVAGESPIMTLRPLERRQYDGGAAILARHIAAMGGLPTLVTALPDDAEAAAFRQRLLAEGVEVKALRTNTSIPEKQRFLVGAQKVMKLDLVNPLVLDAAQHDRLLELANEAAGAGVDAAIIADFGLGLFSPAVVRRLCTTLRPRAMVMAGDVSGRRSNLSNMHSMDLLCPSESELRDSCRMFNEGLPLVTWRLLQKTRSRRAIISMGSDGLIAFDRTIADDHAAEATDDGFKSRLRAEHVPALCPLAVDPLGCGDSLLAAATMALASGGSLLAASFLGACAAGLQVQRLGNIPITSADPRQMITRVHTSHLTYASPDVIASRSRTGPASADPSATAAGMLRAS